MRYLDNSVYNRLFTKILDSSIWLEPTSTRIVWITLLAAMDEDGYAHFSAIENLASRARVSTEEAQKAVDCFLAPDPNSENTEHEGRRVERVPGGFLVLNAEHHRKLLNREIRREQTRLRVAKHRGNKSGVTPALQSVTSASASDVTSVKKRESAEREKQAAEIYEAYPLKKARPEAIKAILKLLNGDHNFQNLLAQTKAYAAARNGDYAYVPNPSTWFNQERFKDDPSTWVNSSQQASNNVKGSQRQMSSWEIKERVQAVNDEINKIFLSAPMVAGYREPTPEQAAEISALKEKRDELKASLAK